MKKLGTIEPRYDDERVRITSNNPINDETLGFIYGAIKKYGTDSEYNDALREYISEIVNFICKD